MSDPTIEQRLAAIEAAQSNPSTPAPAANAAPAPQSPESIAAIVAATIAAMQPQRPAPAAAPSAPSLQGERTLDGLLNIFDPAVSSRLSPREMRTHLERAWEIGAEMSGRPSRPKPNR